MKTRKTAGTSIQVALSRICGSDDIITGTCINDEGIMDESHSSGKNIDKFFTNHPHPPLIQVKQFLGEDVWDSYFKFGFVRNPYEIAVSRYFWEKRGKEKNVVKCGIDEFREWSKTNLKDYDWMHTYTALNGVVDLDYIGRYENLVEDFGNYKLISATNDNIQIKVKVKRESIIPEDKILLEIPPEHCCIYNNEELVE